MDRLQLCALQIDIISRIGPRPAAFPRIGILISPSASFLRSFSLSLVSSPRVSRLVYSSLIKEPRRRRGEKGGEKEGRRSTRENVYRTVGLCRRCRANVFIKRRKLLTLRI